MTDKYRLRALQACAARFKNDLAAFNDDALTREESEVSDRISTEEEWHEAVCAEIELRGMNK